MSSDYEQQPIGGPGPVDEYGVPPLLPKVKPYEPSATPEPKPTAPPAADPKTAAKYGPLDGNRMISDRAHSYFASMAAMSDNPGAYVRRQIELDRAIAAQGADLSLDDAEHVWSNVFQPQFDQWKTKDVTAEYDANGKALLDQIYAPTEQHPTKATWDQVPKAERLAGAVYALVNLVRGKPAQALQGIARPLARQTDENVKGEALRLQNDQIRRDGLAAQFKVMLDNKRTALGDLSLAQRERQADEALAARNAESLRKQTETITNSQTNSLRQQWTQGRKLPDAAMRKAALADYEAGMRQVTGNVNWKAPPEDYAAANTESTAEKIRTQRFKNMQQTYSQKAEEFAPKLKILKQRGLTDEYTYKNILPHRDKLLQDHDAESMLRADKLRYQKGKGWVAGSGKGKAITPAQVTAALKTKLAILGDEATKIKQSMEIGLDTTPGSADMQVLQIIQARTDEWLGDGRSPQDVEKMIRDELRDPLTGISILDVQEMGQYLPRIISVAAERRKTVAKLGLVASQVEAGTSGTPATTGGAKTYQTPGGTATFSFGK